MNKNDYIRILRELENDLKNEIKEDNDFFEMCNFEETMEEVSKLKSEYICKAITFYMVLYFLIKQDYKLASVLFGMLGTINLTKAIIVNLNGKLFEENYLTVEKVDSNLKDEIDKLENSISLFQNSSEEEVQKYLSYKMGDSKKKLTGLD